MSRTGGRGRYAVSNARSHGVRDGPNYVERLWNFLMDFRHYNGSEFRLLFAYDAESQQVKTVDLHTGILPVVIFKLYADHDSPAATFIPRRPNLWDTASDTTFALIRQWISDCDNNHTCRTLSATPRAPKRLLDLRGGSLGPDIKLIDTRSISGFPRYAALSYCWGNPKEHHQLKTLKSNITNHQDQIKSSSLPKTISDAVIFCRKLDIPYLWVDALCIVQDDDADKLSEIEAMGHIYANDFLTIAATSSSGSDDGFLQPRQNFCFSAPFPAPDGGVMDLKWNWHGRGFLNHTNEITQWDGKHKNAKNMESWHSRGWTFQEIMLSRRTILLSVFQPYWICQDSLRAGGEPSPEEYVSAVGLENSIRGMAPGKSSMTAESAMNSEYKWPWIAENYSARLLSVLDDKPLAIHSIREQNVQQGGTYTAGVWSTHIAVDLLWSTIRCHSRSSEELQRFGSLYEQGRITNLPSWSWLSFDGVVRFEAVWHALYTGKIKYFDEINTRIEILETPEVDVFGRLERGCLRIRGPMKRVLAIPIQGPSWEKRPQRLSCYDTKIWDGAAKSYSDAKPEASAAASRIGEVVFDNFKDGPPSSVSDLILRTDWSFAEDYEAAPRVFDCLVVATVGNRQEHRSLATDSRKYSMMTQGNEVAYGLLLEVLSGSGGQKWKRVGLFRGDEGRSFYFDDTDEKDFSFV
ncbi:heterokaryon incompatibility protein-domain-containing protein [Dactylonectria macrodidyma]|uniref:Heterokaryon incompatibility protein-domain-containing protein n=1 Tax=Dactylonectria macrodidyma TaxID=307937 RepID=A0A9P9E789_9HYPO|nr:heterokaryon incompatibility protein-domain-containing protein [Dactylonectria macrodidyma]